MKKIMIAFASVALATVANAAAVGWNCAGATDYIGGSYSIFVVGKNGVTGADQIKQLIIDGGGLSAVNGYAFGSGYEIDSMGGASLPATDSGKSIAWTSGTETYSGFIFVQDGDTASYTGTKNVTLKNDSTGKNFAFGNQAENFTNNEFTLTPEPTSGLLLLLGMGALALRRRRA